MSTMFGSIAFVIIAAVVIVGIVIALLVGFGRKKTDWAGDPRPPQQQAPQQPGDPQRSPYEQQQPPQQPGDPRQQQPPRSIDDSQQFREQNRQTDPPAPA